MFVRLTSQNISRHQERLEEFETLFRYPLGEDEFTISHGKNYLGFIERIGPHVTYFGEHEGKIISIGAGTISRRHKAWYLCDMKVHPEHRGKGIPRKLFSRYFFFNYLKCRRGFALNMVSADGKKNPIVKIMENFPWTPLKVGTKLNFYYEDHANTLDALKILGRPNPHFSSLAGKKDLVLKSSGAPIPLLHLEWGVKAFDFASVEPQPGKLHMWCEPEGSEASANLTKKNIHPKATGLIFHHGMDKFNWKELRTSEL
ncbi:MAG: GNAT family N-acetyltransferase [Bacteriovoracaceae bacterium]